MSVRRILLISPSVPSGAAWLANCLMELGIKVDVPALHGGSLWEEKEGRLTLNPKREFEKRRFPILSSRSEFDFRKDVEVVFMHNWLKEEYKPEQVIFWIRDPRDALYSMYRRKFPTKSIAFREYANAIQPKTLLTVVDAWAFFQRCWLTHSRLRFFRFEDYKANGRDVLSRVAQYIDLRIDERAIDRAVQASSYERTVQVEREHIPQGKALLNRASSAGQWRNLEGEDLQVVKEIETRCADILPLFGYGDGTGSGGKNVEECLSEVRLLPFFSRMSALTAKEERSAAMPAASTFPNRYYSAIFSFISSTDEDFIRRAYRPSDVPVLLRNLIRFCVNAHMDAIGPLPKLCGAFSYEPVDYHQRLLKEKLFKELCGKGLKRHYLGKFKRKLAQRKEAGANLPPGGVVRGSCYWITGLAGSGKTTIGRELYRRLSAVQANIVFLDGDVLRGVFGKGIGHSVEERRKLAMSYARLARLLVDQGIDVICSTISLFKEVHEFNREHIESYFEIFVDCPMEELVRRDQKGIYSKALKGEMTDVVGVDIPYERPEECDLVIDNSRTDGLKEKVSSILKLARVKA